MLSLRHAHSPPPHDKQNSALPQVPQHFEGALANRSLVTPKLILSASYHMVLTRERKNSSPIAQEIKIFSIFAWLVPTMVLKHYLRLWVFSSTICWSWWLINIYETFGRNKIAVSLWNLVSVPCSETGPNLRMSLFVDPWLSWLYITKICTEEIYLIFFYYISILKQNKSTLYILREEISANGISTIGKWVFTILQNR